MKDLKTAKMGFAQRDITPSGTVETIGFGREDNRSRGVLHPLLAQVSVWEYDGRRCALICIDHIGFHVSHAEKLREKVALQLSTGKEQVMLCFSHTHAAPNDSVETEYLEMVYRQVQEAVTQAKREMRPVYAAWGNAEADIGVNRRNGSGNLYRRIGILKVTDQNGKLRLLLLRLTAHANVLKSDNYLISSDFFGAVRLLLEKAYGCPVMATQGAAGNVAPRFFCSDFTPVDAQGDAFIRSPDALADMAREVFRGTERVMAAISPKPVKSLHTYSIYAQFDADVPDWTQAQKVFREAKQYAGIDGSNWLKEVRRLLDDGISQQKERVEIQYFTLNEGCLCGVPNELMCEFALEVSQSLHDPYFYLGGYTNGCTGYWPTAEEYDRGGYEVFWSMLHYYPYYGRVFPLNRNSGKQLVQIVCEHAALFKK